MEKEELLRQLNEEQRAAVEYNDGPSLVIAGAGSGKTRVLTYKIAYLIQLGVKPWNILALTFTNKAAGEMKERIARIVGEENAQSITMGTFHSVFARILRIEAERINYNSQFTIYDEADSRSLIKTLVKEMDLDPKAYAPAAVHSSISLAKNNLIDAKSYAYDEIALNRDQEAGIPDTHKIYDAYQQRCRTSNAMDFDDLLMMTYELFNQNDDVRKKWADKFKYILVDEYQDTNKVQQLVVEQLARENRHVCVVGDDAQSIYAFRGANLDNMLDFNLTYSEVKTFKLERNYRSTQNIVQAANSLILHNKRQIRKDVFSRNAKGEKLQLKNAISDTEEASIVCKTIKRIRKDEGAEYSDFAILYRTNAQSRNFEDAFLKEGIPYKIYGGLSFYQRKEIKDIIAYFRLTANPNDEEAFKRIVNYPARGIGQTTMDKLAATAVAHNASFWDVSCDPDRFVLPVNAGTKTKLKNFTELIQSFRERLDTEDAVTLGRDIIKQSGIYKDIYSSNDPDYLSRQDNIEEFFNAINEFVTNMTEQGLMQEARLTNFLQEISLQTDRESDDTDESRVALMTVHAAKGLEFPTVFIVGLEDEIFPSKKSMYSQKSLEEERRLLYVAITRAEKHCILTCAKNRWRYGAMERFKTSRFIREIDGKYIDSGEGSDEKSTGYFSSGRQYSNFSSGRVQNSRPVASQFRADVEYKITRPQKPEPKTDPFTPSFRRKLEEAQGKKPATKTAANGLSVGNIIEHERFGIGRVTSIEGEGGDTKATVEFENSGTKKLMLKYSKYVVVK